MSANLKWCIDRWKLMNHPKEDLYRLKQFMQSLFFDFILTKKKLGKAVFDVKKNIGYKRLNEIIDVNRDDYKNFHFLNTSINDILNFKSWNFDVKNNIKGPVKLIGHISNNSPSKYEVKYLYELSRLQMLPVLSAYSVIHYNKSEISVKKIIRDWFSENPFLKTIAWKCGNDVGIRALNLVYTRIILSCPGLKSSTISKFKKDANFESFLDELIYLHYKFLITHPSRYSSLGNHRVGELTGLIAICSTHTFKNSDKCLKESLSELTGLMDKLIYCDGFNKEQSTHYQASYINLFLFSFIIAKQYKGYIIPKDVNLKLKKMFESLILLKVKTREFINLGDNDDGELIYPFSDNKYNLYESLLNDFSILYNKEIDKSYHFDLRNYLLLGDKGYDDYNRLKSKDIISDKKEVSLLKDTGCFIINENNVHLLFDVGKIGMPPVMCHGHSDILSFVLYYKELPFIIDSGTFQYNDKYKKYREYFRGVSAHNTISINKRDQAVKGNGMFWMSNPDVKIIDYNLCKESPFCIATHNGYCNKGEMIIHKRKVDFNNTDSIITINDFLFKDDDNIKVDYKKLLLSDTHNSFDCTFYLNFHPDVKVELKNDFIYAENNGVKIKIENKLFSKHAKLYFGNKESLHGWFAPSYDKIIPTHSLVCEMNDITKKELVTKIYLN